MITADELVSYPVGEALCDRLARDYSEDSISSLDESSLYRLVAQAALSVTTAVGRYRATLRTSAQQRQRAAVGVVEHLRSGWFAATGPTPTQIRISDHPGDGEHFVITNSTGASSKPVGGLWTASVLPDGSSAWQPIIDSGYLGSRGGRSEPVSVDIGRLRIFEITSALSWHELCERFPRRTAAGLEVDWPAARDAFDGVHLSAVGLLRAQDVATGDNSTSTCLRGWDAESTVWLRSPL